MFQLVDSHGLVYETADKSHLKLCIQRGYIIDSFDGIGPIRIRLPKDITMQCLHSWKVYSTALIEYVLLVRCDNCGQTGYVPNPTREEWQAAFEAPEKPYPWTQTERIIIQP